MPSRSSTSGDYLAVAQVLAPHGVRGELRCAIITDFPERFRHTQQLYVGEDHVTHRLQRSRLVNRAVVLKLDGVDSRDQAAALRGKFLYVAAADAVTLPSGSYFWHEIIGLHVRTTEGRTLGTICEILTTGSNDVYVVRGQGEGTEVLLPAIREVVLDVDLAAGQMTVELLAGLT